MPWALAVSGLLHGGLAALALAPSAAATAEPPPLPPDRWAESAVELFEAAAAEPSPGAAAAPEPAPEAPQAPADPVPSPPSGIHAFRPPEHHSNNPAPPRPDKPSMAHNARSSIQEPTGDRPRKPADPAQADEPARPRKRAEKMARSKPPNEPAEAKPTDAKPTDAKPTDAKPARPASPAAANDGAAASAPAGGPTTVGMAGPAAVRDLGMAFTRAIGPAGMTDKAWGALPVGPAGSLDVALDIDDEGKLRGFSPLTKEPPEHLVRLVKQVQWLLRSGFFAIKGPDPTAGKQVVRLSATLSDVAAGDVQGGPSEVKFTYERGKGTSRFTQASGRRVEVRVELLRVEATR